MAASCCAQPGPRSPQALSRAQGDDGSSIASVPISVRRMQNPAPPALQQQLADFVDYRRNHLAGDEKGEAQVFLDRLFKALGHEGVFEAGATLEKRVQRRDHGGTAFADLVWRPRVLVEMKRAGQDLRRHYRQAFEYWIDLVPDRPKYVILCNFDELWVYDLNQQLDEPIDVLLLDELPRRWEVLAFLLPEPETPEFSNNLVAVTRDSAATVANVFNNLVHRGIRRSQAQRFILQCVMAMFAEDIDLLSRHSFSRAIEDCTNPADSYDLIFGLFRAMNEPGETPAGRYQTTPYFNGGLYREVEPFALTQTELHALYTASRFDWATVRPAIFGTLFEQSLDSDERHAYGAHFTSETDIQKVVLPTIVRPWRERIEAASSMAELGAVEHDMLAYRVLDAACGCGNFLYVAYRELRRLERQLAEKVQSRRRSARGQQTQLSFVSTGQFYGIDVNTFAVEIAKVTLMLARKLAADELGDDQRVLPLDDLDGNFIADDALTIDWPSYDACIGNPPYLGRRNIIEERGAEYSAWLQEHYPGVRGVSDYVVYWFRRAHDGLPDGGRAGLVATRNIRQGDSRTASLDYVVDNGGVIYDAVANQPWSGDASVEVSIVNWIKNADVEPKTLWLAGGETRIHLPVITGSLSPTVDLRAAKSLSVNRRPKRCFQGQTPGHTRGFILTAAQARRITERYPACRAVMHPFLTGDELNNAGSPTRWVIDIPDTDAASAARWGPAYEHVREHVLPVRQQRAEVERLRNETLQTTHPNFRPNRHHQNFLDKWWQLSYRRLDLIDEVSRLDRYIALSRVAVGGRQSIYAFVDATIRPSDALQVFTFDDDYSLGILHSTIHRRWFEERCSNMRVDLRYTSTTVFDSFPWPQAVTASQTNAISGTVAELLAYRAEASERGLSLATLYNTMREPGRNALSDLHRQLDMAVSDAYRFDADEDTLAQLLALNASIAESESDDSMITAVPPGPPLMGLSRITNSRLSA